MSVDWKVGDRFVLVDGENSGFDAGENGSRGIVKSLVYEDRYNDPESQFSRRIPREECVYGDLEGQEYGGEYFFKKSCIRPLTKLERALK